MGIHPGAANLFNVCCVVHWNAKEDEESICIIRELILLQTCNVIGGEQNGTNTIPKKWDASQVKLCISCTPAHVLFMIHSHHFAHATLHTPFSPLCTRQS